MPELPEVECLARAVRTVLEGGIVVDAEFLRRDLRVPIPIQAFKKIVVGHRIESVERRSKYILVQTALGHGVFHLGMTGNILFKSTDSISEAHTHARFKIRTAAGESAWLHFVDPRRFGRIDAIGGGAQALAKHPIFADLGIEPLARSAARLGSELFAAARNRAAPIKSFLMDQRVVVGVGNIYASESLFRAGINPSRPAKAVSRQEFQRLAKAVQKTLEGAIAAGGTSFSDYRHLDGEAGYFQIKLNVYGRAGEACMKCRHPISHGRHSGRSTFFCEHCQV